MKNNIIFYLLIFANILLSEVKIGYVDSQQVMTQYEGLGWRLAKDLSKDFTSGPPIKNPLLRTFKTAESIS